MTGRDWTSSSLGERIQHARKLRGWSLNKLARLAGIDSGPMSRLGRRPEHVAGAADTLLRIANAARVEVRWLIDGHGPIEKAAPQGPEEHRQTAAELARDLGVAHVDLLERLKWLVEHRAPRDRYGRPSARALSIAAELGPGNLGVLMSRLHRRPGSGVELKTLEALARAGRVSPSWLTTGEGSPEVASRATLLGMAAAKKGSGGNGHSTITEEMVALLKEIRDDIRAFKDETRGELTDIRGELREMHHQIADTNERVTETNTRLVELGAALRSDFSKLGLDLAKLRVDVSKIDTRRDHDARIEKLEEAVFKRTG